MIAQHPNSASHERLDNASLPRKNTTDSSANKSITPASSHANRTTPSVQMLLLQPTTLRPRPPTAHCQALPQLEPRSTFRSTTQFARTTRTSFPGDQLVPASGLQLCTRPASRNSKMVRPPDSSYRQLLTTRQPSSTTHSPSPRLQDLQHDLLLSQITIRVHRLEQSTIGNAPAAMGSTHSHQHQHAQTHANNIPRGVRE